MADCLSTRQRNRFMWHKLLPCWRIEGRTMVFLRQRGKGDATSHYEAPWLRLAAAGGSVKWPACSIMLSAWVAHRNHSAEWCETGCILESWDVIYLWHRMVKPASWPIPGILIRNWSGLSKRSVLDRTRSSFIILSCWSRRSSYCAMSKSNVFFPYLVSNSSDRIILGVWIGIGQELVQGNRTWILCKLLQYRLFW